MKLAGRVAVVTGGAKGIGRGIGKALAIDGASVVVVDVDLPGAEETAASLPVHEAMRHLAVYTDVSDAASVRGLSDRICGNYGKLDILVNNAGICPLADFENLTEGDWDRVLAVNLKGAFLCCQACLPLLKKSAAGRIINISSVAGKMGALIAGAHYTASKAGMLGLTWSLARYCAAFGVTVNAIAPAAVETELTASWSSDQRDSLRGKTPLGRLGLPEDIGAAAAFLASSEAGFITGEVLDVNGGFLMD
jgi:3-oxoacyl-[acyl-carrier protein] reductase